MDSLPSILDEYADNCNCGKRTRRIPKQALWPPQRYEDYTSEPRTEEEERQYQEDALEYVQNALRKYTKQRLPTTTQACWKLWAIVSCTSRKELEEFLAEELPWERARRLADIRREVTSL